LQIVNVEPRWYAQEDPCDEPLYDIEVEGTHCYFANGVLVSNSHIQLAEPMPNPLFEKAIKSLTGLDTAEFDGLMDGSLAYDEESKALVKDEGQDGVLRAGRAIESMLKGIDRDQELDALIESVPTARGTALDKTVKKLKILRALKKANLQPTVYVQGVLPVLPPQFRPISVTGKGDVAYSDLNAIYKALALDNQQLRDFPSGLPDSEKAELRAEMYDGLKSLIGLGGTLNREQELSGVMDVIHGSELKHGFFQKMLIKRRQDMTARGVVVPDLDIGLDELGVPKFVAKTLYEPFVIRAMGQPPYSMSVANAKEALEREDAGAMHVLENEMAARPLAMKRDPVLHKHSIMGFYPKMIAGSSIHVNPMVVVGYNMDFDGDQASLYVPLTHEAVDDVKNMLPTNILRSPAGHELMYFPRLESLLGLFLMTKDGNKTPRQFKDTSDLLSAYEKGEVGQTDVVHVGKRPTTAGRAMVATAVGETGDIGKSWHEKILYDSSFVLDKKTSGKMMSDFTSDPVKFKSLAEKLSKMGFVNATEQGFSFDLSDFKTLHAIRDRHLAAADAEVAKIPKGAKHRNDRLVEAYEAAGVKIKADVEAKFGKEYNALFTMYKAGTKGSWEQLRQILTTPLLVASVNGTIPFPIRHSYSEGLDTAEYWVASHGGRKSMFDRVAEASLPGAINKQLTNVAMDIVVTEKDCGASGGVHRPIDSGDILDRFTAEPIKIGTRTVPAGTLVTSQLVSELKRAKKNSVVVRSPLKHKGKGMCQHCYGLGPDGKVPQVGANVGVVAAQSLGERGVQLAMRSFHCNHRDSVVYARQIGGEPVVTSMAKFFDLVPGPVEAVDGEEVKEVSGWEVWDNEWTPVTHVRRHAPDRPMTAVGARGVVTICQDNHPVQVRDNPVACEKCGYHRLKERSAAAKRRSPKYDRVMCPECGAYQARQEGEPGWPYFLPAGEVEPRRFYLSVDLTAALGGAPVDPPALDPYLVGAFLAEGCVDYRRASPRSCEKKPYSVTISQNDGPVKDQILAALPLEWKPEVRPRYIRVHSLEVGQEFEALFGRYSYNKALPSGFLRYPRQWLLDVLAGLVDGDGCKVSSGHGPDQLCVDTTSFELAQQIQLIGAAYGIPVVINLATVRKLTRHQGYQVRLVVTERTLQALGRSVKARSFTNPSPYGTGSFVGERLVSVLKTAFYHDPWVYDLTTASGTLFVSGVRSHNTAGVTGKKSVINSIGRVRQLVAMPEILPNQATLAQESGNVTKIAPDPVGGYRVWVGNQDHYVPHGQDLIVKKGQKLKRGDPLTAGPINPHELLPLAGINAVQNYLTDELDGLYAKEGVRRVHSEVLVRSLTNLGKVVDAGDNPDLLPSDMTNVQAIEAWNAEHKGEKPVKYEAVLKGAEMLPLEQSTDWLARLAYRRPTETISRGAAEGWSSAIHGQHPIPGVVYGAEFGKPKDEKKGPY